MAKGAYTPEFTPVAQKDHVVQLDFGNERQLHRIGQVAPLPTIESQTFTVADNDREANVDLKNLEVWDGWLAQYRMPRLTEELPDDVTLEFDQGGNQAPLYQNQNVRGEITNETPYQLVSDPDDSAVDIESLVHLLELFVYEQETPAVTVQNDSGEEVDFSLTFSGWAFNTERIKETDEQPIYVPVESIRGE